MKFDKKFLFKNLLKSKNLEEALEGGIRNLILSGEYPEGMRLPNTLEWARELGVNDRRVQRVLTRLAAQGYLERRPRYGTYIRRNHKQPTVVILVAHALITEHLHHLRKVVELLLAELNRFGYRAEVIDDLFSILVNDFEEHQIRVTRLRNRLEQIDPCGYIECSFDLSRLQDLYPALARPLVSFYPTTSGGDIYFDDKSFVWESLKYLASKGRRKVLLVRSAGRLGPVHHSTSTFWKGVNEFGFTRGAFRELYHGAVTDSMEDQAFRWMLQLIESWKGLRKNYVPDCLVVGDDIVMRGIARGLRQANVRIPEDLLIAVLANEGICFPYGIPVVRCEISLLELAQNLVELLDARITKKKQPKTPILQSRFSITESYF